MHYNKIMCFSVLVVVSVFFSMSSATDIDFVGVATSIVVPHPLPPQTEETTPKDDDGKRGKRSTSSIDRTTVVNKVNTLRKSVGASDMNYLTYSTSLESDVANWTGYCNFDTYIYTSQPAFVVYYLSTLFDTQDQDTVLEYVYSDPNRSNGVRSIYLQSVGAYSRLCLTAKSKGKYNDFVYVNAYAFAKTSYFNENVTQYTRGKECTTCRSGSFWCYEGLCRDDCSRQMSTCSCFSGCKKCSDWNKESCSCPSQSITDAEKLDCYNGGEMTFKAGASMAMIILSTLTLVGLH